MDTAKIVEPVRYHVTGMDCTSCAAKIEEAARKVPGVHDVRVSIASQEMTLRLEIMAPPVDALERTISGLGYQLSRLDDDDSRIPDLAHVTPAYIRALWTVMLLNLGYGLVEIIGGFIAGSQALKADALDFLGDGLFSARGLIAVGWSLAARAKAALRQGIFLGLLGIGILLVTAYRVLVLQQPQAQLMGILGLIALAVNVAAAAVLIPHRHGDANVRAVWFFSRNDAIGNCTVVLAALLVAWAGTPWPDLLAAVIIAGLSLQSSFAIIRDARKELMSARARGIE